MAHLATPFVGLPVVNSNISKSVESCITHTFWYAILSVHYTPVYMKSLFLADGDYAHIKY